VTIQGLRGWGRMSSNNGFMGILAPSIRVTRVALRFYIALDPLKQRVKIMYGAVQTVDRIAEVGAQRTSIAQSNLVYAKRVEVFEVEKEGFVPEFEQHFKAGRR